MAHIYLVVKEPNSGSFVLNMVHPNEGTLRGVKEMIHYRQSLMLRTKT